MYKINVFFCLFFMSISVYATSSKEDSTNGVERLDGLLNPLPNQDLKNNLSNKELQRDFERVYFGMQRIELEKSIETKALAKHISELESKLKIQEKIIANYEAVILKLQSQIKDAN